MSYTRASIDGSMAQLVSRRAATLSIAKRRLRNGWLDLLDETWNHVESAIQDGSDVLVMGIGSIEQHGFHLPMATDTLITDVLVERFCGKVPSAIRGPTLPIGVANDHTAFAGTLSLSPETLAGFVEDVWASVGGHGLRRLVLLTGHFGNFKPIGRLLSQRRTRSIIAFTDHEKLRSELEQVALRDGVSAAAAGQHAGEIETSIMLRLAPNLVRSEAFLADGMGEVPEGSHLFRELRKFAPSGTVGDPRGANAERGERYLRQWVSLLVDWYSSTDFGASETRSE